MQTLDHRARPSALPFMGSANGLVFILGAPRSGTSWLAKIFDSHSQVVYRHEPDTIIRSRVLPVICPAVAVDRYRDLALDYLRELAHLDTLKTGGSLPVFPKHYLPSMQTRLRQAIALIGRAAALAGGEGAFARLRMLPPLHLDRLSGVTVVMKSVSARGRAGLFAAAAPDSHFLFLVRHPCGQVASMMHGITSGKFQSPFLPEEVLETELARAHGLDRQAMNAMPLVERLAWHWAILNQKALDDLRAGANFRQVSYEALCEQPLAVARDLFRFAGLSWPAATAQFIEESTTYRGQTRYYDVKANTAEMVGKWKTALDRLDQERIMAVARKFPIGRAYDL